MGARGTRSTPITMANSQEPSRTENAATATQGSGSPLEIEAEQTAIRARIAQLEELQKLREKEEELRRLINCPIGGNPRDAPAKRRRDSQESSGSSGQEIKVKNITALTHPTNPQKHKVWINDLNRAFNGAKRKYRRDYRKILFALDHMNITCRARWDRYLDEQPDNEREEIEDNWDLFQTWTLTLLRDAANREAQIAMQLEKAQQLEGQSPMDFSIYLDSLEKHLERPSEKARALSFFAKLRPDLQDHINLHASITGMTREEVIQMAQRFWDAMPGKGKRKQEAAAEKNRPPKSSRHQRDDSPGNRRLRGGKYQPSSPNNINPQWKPRCYNCGSENHLRPACDKPPKNPQNTSGNGQRQK